MSFLLFTQLYGSQLFKNYRTTLRRKGVVAESETLEDEIEQPRRRLEISIEEIPSMNSQKNRSMIKSEKSILFNKSMVEILSVDIISSLDLVKSKVSIGI
ncbi:hypothetical protein U1Q18_017753 [Sarracenia purpurea var. burkii]